MVGHREVELVAKEIQDDNPGMTYQVAMEYAKENVINKQKNQTILFIMPINYSYNYIKKTHGKILKTKKVRTFSNLDDF